MALKNELNSTNVQNIYKLSPLQEGIYFHSIREEKTAAYFCQSVYRIMMPVDAAVLQQSLQLLVNRYDILRTVFSHKKTDDIIQVVLKERAADFFFEDISASTAQSGYLSTFCKNDRQRGFDISKDMLLRLSVFRLSENEYEMVCSHHHIIMDGWSSAVFMKELLKVYEMLLKNGQAQLPAPVQFSTYISWLQKKDTAGAEAFWASYLKGYEYRPALTRTVKKSAATGFREISCFLTEELTLQLNTVSAKLSVTTNTFLQTLWGLLLCRLANRDEMVFGAVSSERPADIRGIESSPGLFINTLPVRIGNGGNQRFCDLAAKVQRDALDLQENQFLPLSRIQSLSGVSRQLFDHVYIMENFGSGDGETVQTENAGNIKFKDAFSQTNYDFNLVIVPGRQVEMRYNYNAAVYHDYYITSIKNAFQHLLVQVLNNPDIPVTDLELVDAKTRNTLLIAGQGSSQAWAGTVLEQFEANAAAQPSAPALVDTDGAVISYGELQAKITGFANLLHRSGCRKGMTVAVMTGNTQQTVVAVLASMTIGAIYVPVDENLPRYRVEHILHDAGAAVLVKLSESEMELPSFKGITINADKYYRTGEVLDEMEPVSPADTAYIIYTSGTSGLPKGVPIRHTSLADRIVYHTDYLALTTDDAVLQFASPAFDASLVEIFMALVSGGRLVLLSKAAKQNPDLLTAVLYSKKVTTAIFPPAYLRMLNGTQLAGVKNIISTGEAAVLPDVIALAASRKVINGYGPTEACVGAAFHTADAAAADTYYAAGGLPIGKPFSNTQVYVLDSRQRLLPPGFAGELCIAGAGNTPGYLNRPELTAEKFCDNPFCIADMYKTLYRTGDLCRWNQDGELEYIGRIDNQVQLNGIRVEPGEVEQLLSEYPGVLQCAVAVKKMEGEERLIAYVVMDTQEAMLQQDAVKNYLAGWLPQYMVPRRIEVLEAMPLTANGKIDRRKLPEPADITAAVAIIPPSNEAEADLVEAVCAVMGKKAAGVNIHFFELGGDSIKAIQVSSRLYRKGWKLDLKDIFNNPVLGDMARKMKPTQQAADQGAVEGAVPVNPIQADFFSRQFIAEHHFNQSILLRSISRLDEGAMRLVMKKLQEHHDALRMVYAKDDNGWQQFNRSEEAAAEMLTFDLRTAANPAAALTEKAQQLQRSFDLAAGPLIKAAIFHMPEDDRLLVVVHHLVVDGVSWRILLEDISTLYTQCMEGNGFSLPPKTDSFLKWNTALEAYAGSSSFAQQQQYWLEQLPMLQQDMSIWANGNEAAQGTGTEGFELDETTTEALLTAVNKAYNTEINDILLSGLSAGFCDALQKDNVWITLEGHGREQVVDCDVSRTVGWFTSVYPVCLNAADRTDTGRHIRNIKEQLHQVPDKGIGYGLMRYLSPEGKAVSMRFTDPDIIFNYLGQFDNELTNSGFAGADEYAGDNGNPDEKPMYPLAVSAFVSGGKLAVRLRYNRAAVPAAVAASMCSAMQQSLGSIIQHCRQQTITRLTPSDLISSSVSIRELDAIQDKYQQLCGAAVKDVYPLSPMQEGMLFHNLVEQEGGAYLYQVNYTVNGPVDEATVSETMNRLIARHDILRTVFHFRGTDTLLQVVLASQPSRFTYRDFSDMAAEEEKQEALRQFMQADRNSAFDLEKDCAFRIALVKLNTNTYVFVWTCHHILMDGWCMSIMIKEFKEIYRSLAAAAPAALQPVTPYRNYIKWLQQNNASEAYRYWNSYLDGYTASTILQHSVKSRENNGYLRGLLELPLTPQQTQALRDAAAKCGVTLYNFLQAAWGVLLSKYNNSRDAVFGSIVSGRPPHVEGIETMFGLFINMIPVRVSYDEETSFAALARQVHNDAIAAESYHYCSLAQVQNRTSLKDNPVTHCLEYENFPLSDNIGSKAGASVTDAWQISNVEALEHSSYDFSFKINQGKVISFAFHYNKNVFYDSIIERLGNHYLYLLQQVISNSSMRADDLMLTDINETAELLEMSCGTKNSCVLQTGYVPMLEQQCRYNSSKIALRDNSNAWTYGMVWQHASALAGRLRSMEVKPGDVVAIYMDRSVWVPVSIIAVWMTGAVCLPLDTAQPAGRISLMLEETGAVLTIVDEAANSSRISTPLCVTAESSSCENFPYTDMGMHHAACIIYTSGASGKPQGVIVEQGGMMNQLMAKICDLEIGSESRIAQTAPVDQESGFWQLLAGLLAGAETRIYINDMLQDATAMASAVANDNIDIWQINADAAGDITALLAGSAAPSFSRLRYVLVNGQGLNPVMAEQWLNACPGLCIVSSYGIAETAGDVLHTFIRKEGGQAVTTSRPVSNVQTYVVNHSGQLQPLGIPGQLYVGGIAAAGRYAGGATNPCFVSSQFILSEKAFCTGEKVVRNNDGHITFTERNDGRIYINGCRVELNEVEQTIAAAPWVEEAAAVAAEENGRTVVAAYVRWRNDVEKNPDELRSWVAEKLAPSMMPVCFNEVETFPRDAAGAINRQALRRQPESAGSSVQAYQAPSTPQEKMLCEVWARILDAADISVHDNFFRLGGDSIRAIQISSRVYNEGYRLDVIDVFEAPTISELVHRLKPVKETVNQEAVTGPVALTPVQKRFFAQEYSNPGSFSQGMLLCLSSRTGKDAVADVLSRLCSHHDALRLRFAADAEMIQEIDDTTQPELRCCTLEGTDAEEEMNRICRELQDSFVLSSGGLLKAALFSLPACDYLFIAMHQLVADAVTWTVVLEDIATLLQGEALPMKTNSYRDWSNALIKFSGSKNLNNEKRYWQQLSLKKHSLLEGSAATGVFEKGVKELEADAALTALITGSANEAFKTEPQVLLLAALALAVKNSFGMEQFFIEMEQQGREPLYDTYDFSRTAGCFTSIFPLYADLSNGGAEKSITGIKETLRQIPRSGVGYSILNYINRKEIWVNPDIVFSWMDLPETAVSNSAFSTEWVSFENTVQETPGWKIQVRCFVLNGTIRFRIVYNSAFLSNARAAAFKQALYDALCEIIDCCMQQGESEKSAGDFGYAELANDDLLAINNLLK